MGSLVTQDDAATVLLGKEFRVSADTDGEPEESQDYKHDFQPLESNILIYESKTEEIRNNKDASTTPHMLDPNSAVIKVEDRGM